MNIVIPAAGRGSRFLKSHAGIPKPLIPVNDSIMLIEAIKTLDISGNYFIIVQRDRFIKKTIEYIKTTIPDCIVLTIDYYTKGTASSVLLCKNFMDQNDELIVANCDQIMNWNSSLALSALRKYDAGVVTIKDDNPKHSFVKVDKHGLATEFAEKETISNIALTGLHYWKKSKYFFDSALSMIRNDRYVKNEFYIAPSFNELIKKGYKVGCFTIDKSNINFLGTPEDLELYEKTKIN